MQIERSVLEALEDRGIGFMIGIPTASGRPDYTFSTDDVLLYLEDADALYAKHYGITKEQYRDCIESDYSAYCSANTKHGRPCKNIITGGWRVDPDRWVKLQNRYCDLHEGERTAPR